MIPQWVSYCSLIDGASLEPSCLTAKLSYSISLKNVQMVWSALADYLEVGLGGLRLCLLPF